MVTFANGGDNIGVYLPVFATTSTANVVIYRAVFLVMVGVWALSGASLLPADPSQRPCRGGVTSCCPWC
jgi:cadmium resistance protein CadD (predicted permease)